MDIERERWHVTATSTVAIGTTTSAGVRVAHVAHDVLDQTGALVASARSDDVARAVSALPDLVRAGRAAVAAVAEYEAFLPPSAAAALGEMRAALAEAGVRA